MSISSDGIINLWTMNKSELTHEVLMKLTMVPKKGEQASGTEDDGAALSNMPAGGCCMDFCKVGVNLQRLRQPFEQAALCEVECSRHSLGLCACATYSL